MKLLRVFFVLAGALFAANGPTVTQRQLDSWVKYWKHVLTLDDWDCSIRMVGVADLPEGTLGSSQAIKPVHFVFISVLRPEDYLKLSKHDSDIPSTPKAIVDDIQNTVVHELVHVRLQEFAVADGSHIQEIEEMTVQRLATALLDAKYGRHK